MVAQGGHAYCSWMADLIRQMIRHSASGHMYEWEPKPSKEEYEWIYGKFTKICVGVDSLEELEGIHKKAIDAGLKSIEIIDSGATEFNGEPTKTCIAIGPDDSEKIDEITGHLKLL